MLHPPPSEKKKKSKQQTHPAKQKNNVDLCECKAIKCVSIRDF